MKKLVLLGLVLISCLSVFAIASCGAPEIEGISFSNKQEVYDGTEKSIEVAGLPAGATVTYSPQNTYKDAGTYTVTVTVKQEGFADTTLTATLKIDPKVVTVTYGDLVFKASGEAPKKVDYTVNGLVPGDSVELEFDFGECDFYEEDYEGTLTAKSKNPNYTLKASSQSKKFTVGPNEHTVRFETGVVNQTLDSQVVADATRAREPRKIINTGYEFIGWFNGEEKWDFAADKVTDDMILVAKWRANMYNINYYLDGGVNSSKNPTKFSYDEGYTLEAPTKEGYVFEGWYEDAKLTVRAKDKAPSTRATHAYYYAKWSYAPKSELDKPVWVIGDNVNAADPYTWTAKLRELGYVDFLAISPEGLDSASALEYLTNALKSATPKYIIWSFAAESGESYDISVNNFLTLCDVNGVTAVLTTQPAVFGEANEAKNATVKASGAAYIDFAAVIGGADYVSGGKYNALGVAAAAGKAIVDLPEMITPESPIKNEKAEALNAATDTVSLGNVRIKDSKYYVFSAELSEFSDGAKIFINHGYMTSYGRWIEITNKKLDVFGYTSWSETPLHNYVSAEHGLEFKSYITVIIKVDTDNGGGHILILTDGGSYERSVGHFNSCEGEVGIKCEGVELRNAEISFACKDYSKDIWIIGASYLSLSDPARWPYYLYEENYFNALLVGRGGMGNQHAIEDFKDALKHGKPKYLVWDSASGNNNDSTITNPTPVVNQTFLVHMLEVMELCKQNDIELIIEILPNCIERTNYYKNKMLINREGEFANYEYELIDIARSLGAHDEFSSWYEGMLYTDKVHPTKLGAVAYYLQMLVDFPELMSKTCAKVYRAVKNTLSSSDTLTIEAPERIEHSKVITFTADMAGTFTGAIEIGNGKDVDGGTYVRIERDKICVYTNRNGETVKTEIDYRQYAGANGKPAGAVGEEVPNVVDIGDYINVKIHVDGYRAKISIMSRGLDMGEDAKGAKYVELFSVESDWTFAGDVFASAEGQTLTNAKLSFFTE